MSWKKNKVDVNNGAGGERWTRRAHIKNECRKLRRRWSKYLSKRLDERGTK